MRQWDTANLQARMIKHYNVFWKEAEESSQVANSVSLGILKTDILVDDLGLLELGPED